MSVSNLLREAEQACKQGDVRLGDLLDKLSHRAIGAMILLPALIVICPASIIPGISAVCAVIVFAAFIQALTGRKRMWLPKRLRDIPVKGDSAARVLSKITVMATRIDRLSMPRCHFMTRGLAEKATSLVGAGLGASSVVFSFIPFIDMILMFPVVLFGLGLCTGDGLVIGLGWGVIAMFLGLSRFIF